MALDLSHANSLMAKTQHIVNGYIRQIQQSLSISIPSGLIALFLLFYGDQIDAFDAEYIGNWLELSNDKLTITVSENYQKGNAFGTIICDRGVYEWKFKINTTGQPPSMIIGVWRIQDGKSPPTELYFTNGYEQGYGYYLNGEKLSITTGACTGEQYGKKCEAGDIVHMSLDLNKMELSYKVNDVDYGVAYDNIKESKYRAAVWIHCLNNKVATSVSIV